MKYTVVGSMTRYDKNGERKVYNNGDEISVTSREVMLFPNKFKPVLWEETPEDEAVHEETPEDEAVHEETPEETANEPPEVEAKKPRRAKSTAETV